MSEDSSVNDVLIDNEEIAEDIAKFDPSDIVVYSRDWTIETIQAQIIGGNIDLNPKFQRRNAWNDDKRSKLIESIIIGYPVPEIVLAEDPKKKKSFIVIDGKQRLLSIAGYIKHEEFEYWSNPSLINLKMRDDLNGVTYSSLSSESKYSNEYREFQNSSLRCTVITNFTSTDVLYDIFYRLNSGSVPLSTQELRQVLNRGDFANHLVTITNELQPIHSVMNLTGPDKRLRDIEIILRVMSMYMFSNKYTGSLKKFLDDSMKDMTDMWAKDHRNVVECYSRLNIAISILSEIFDDIKKVGRKITDGVFEKRFNRVLFEVQCFFLMKMENPDQIQKEKFISELTILCDNDSEFRSSIESSTKNMDSYKIRYRKFKELIEKCGGCSVVNPFE